MTGPRSTIVRPHRTRARPLLPFLAAIMLSSLACSEQPGITESSEPGRRERSTRLHPYVQNKSRPLSRGEAFAQVPIPARLVSLGASRSSGRVLLIASTRMELRPLRLANSIAGAGFLVNVRPAPEYTWDGTNPPLDGYDLVLHLNGNYLLEGQVLSATAQGALSGLRARRWWLSSVRSGIATRQTDQQAVMHDLVLAGFPAR